MSAATAIVHAGPPTGAGFTEYTAEMQAGGTLGPTQWQRFVYVITGEIAAGNQSLGPGDFAYIPQSSSQVVTAHGAASIIVIEKDFVPGPEMPGFFTGSESQIASQPLMGDPSLQVRTLIPDAPEFDLAVNTMTFEPGAALALVEMHVMEHGLLMLEGGGIYRLSDCWYPVQAGDFIYMAPFCPQWFGALGKSRAKYLIYKDWNRHPAAR